MTTKQKTKHLPDIPTLSEGENHRASVIEALFIIGYFALYVAYLVFFIRLENEITHWITLVSLPLLLVHLLRKRHAGQSSFSTTLDSVGLSRERFSAGLTAALLIGSALGLVQILLSRSSAAIVDVFVSGRFIYAFPLAFMLMVITAGFTEEFFFRGLLQTRVSKFLRSETKGVLVSSVLFGIYHLPYAYLLESWPTHGDFAAALGEGAIMPAILGIIMGAMFAKYKNLLVPVIIHSMMNAYWAMTMINF